MRILGAQGASEVKILPVFPSGSGICGEACGLFLTTFYNNNTAHHASHAQTPKKSVLELPPSLRHLFRFLEMELLFLYTFLPTFRSMPGTSRTMMHAVIRSICHTSPLQSLAFTVLSMGNVLSPLLHIHILSFKIQMPPPPRSPPSFSPWVMDCPFLLLPQLFTCTSV